MDNLTTSIDHLVISCYSIQDGIDYVFERLGVKPEAGGKHDRMGTHNQLLKLGETLYLEVIAIDREAANPSRPRWFAMDELNPNTKPRLVTWVARTNNIQDATKRSSLSHGIIESMSRGNFHW